MMVVNLPYVEPPKSMTASHRPLNLEEHAIAFLAANNRSGFEVDSSALRPGPFKELVEELSEQPSITKKSLKRLVHRMKLMTGKTIGHCRLQEICASVFGYKSYNGMYHTGMTFDRVTGQHSFRNLRKEFT